MPVIKAQLLLLHQPNNCKLSSKACFFSGPQGRCCVSQSFKLIKQASRACGSFYLCLEAATDIHRLNWVAHRTGSHTTQHCSLKVNQPSVGQNWVSASQKKVKLALAHNAILVDEVAKVFGWFLDLGV